MNVQAWRELQEGDSGSAVTGLQYLLREHGFDVVADGDFGPVTAVAVRQFQDGRGMPFAGRVEANTWRALALVSGPGSTGEAVRGVQSFGLVVIPGHEPLVVDGVYGPVTRERVLGFQGTWGLTVDGVAGHETWSYLTAGGQAWPLVKPGATDTTNYRVSPVQHLLRHHGFGVAVDGVYGPQTGEAVRQFDGSNRVVFVSDTVGSLTWPALVVEVGPGDSGEAVRAVQRVAGPLTVDGEFGPKTEAAVRDFQERFGLVVDGIVGQDTWHALMVPKFD